MKKSSQTRLLLTSLFVTLTFLFSGSLSAQEFHGGSSMPSYKGGNAAIVDIINKNLVFPDSLKSRGIAGIVTIKLSINNQGKVEDIRLMKGIHPVCDMEAMQVAGLLTDWSPAINWGTRADCNVLLPVEFPGEVATGDTSVVITGKVSEIATGNAIAGAFIFVKGTNIGTLTDGEGNYMLNLTGDNYDLEISFIGYNSRTEHIGNNRTINVELEKGYCILNYQDGTAK